MSEIRSSAGWRSRCPTRAEVKAHRVNFPGGWWQHRVVVNDERPWAHSPCERHIHNPGRSHKAIHKEPGSFVQWRPYDYNGTPATWPDATPNAVVPRVLEWNDATHPGGRA